MIQRSIRRTLRAVILGTALASLPAMAPSAYGESAEPRRNLRNTVADIVIVRPISLIPIAVGGAMFVIAYPIARLGGSPIDVTDICITQPVEYTFKRPLGEL